MQSGNTVTGIYVHLLFFLPIISSYRIITTATWKQDQECSSGQVKMHKISHKISLNQDLLKSTVFVHLLKNQWCLYLSFHWWPLFAFKTAIVNMILPFFFNLVNTYWIGSKLQISKSIIQKSRQIIRSILYSYKSLSCHPFEWTWG